MFIAKGGGVNTRVIGSIIFLAAVLFCGFKVLYPDGLVGQTQKPLNAPVFLVKGCFCHGDSSSPNVNVWIDGPETLRAGTRGLYRLYVAKNSNIAAGFDVAAFLGDLGVYDSAGTQLMRVDPNNPVDSLELTHTAPRLANGNDTISWSFWYRAPQSYGIADTIYANGNSVDTSQDPSGDFWAFAPNFLVHIVDPTDVRSVPILAGWNMISNPMTVANDSVRALYPTSSFAYAYAFSGGYLQRSTLTNGVGYWGKFPSASTQPIVGIPRTSDSISVITGWNMVGTISDPVDTSTIVSIPGGLRVSSWFGYGVSGYTPATQLVPGKGYWVRSSGVGKFVLTSPLARPAKVHLAAMNTLEVLNTLTITDSKGGSQTLYFGADANKDMSVAMYGMPPTPPAGAFDARFTTSDGGSMVLVHDAKVAGAVEFPVTIQSDAYPLTVVWNVRQGMASYELTDGVGGRVFREKEMRGEGSIKIMNSDLNTLGVKLVGDGQVPVEFALSQNYPNPFNPVTTIHYNLPIDTRVSLHVFNILGQAVAILVNEEQKAGYKSIEWNAGGAASGVYFYRLQTGNFSETKKLLLLR